MKRFFALFLVLVLLLSTSGCTQAADNSEYQEALARIEELETERDNLIAQTEALADEQGRLESEVAILQGQVEELRAELEDALEQAESAAQVASASGSGSYATSGGTVTQDAADSGATQSSIPQASTPQSRQVYYTRTGSKYHYRNPCGNGTYYPCTLDEALAKGLGPCSKCVG